MAERTTAVVQLTRLGDLAQTWPLVHRLRSNEEVTLVVDAGLAPLATLMADAVIPIDLLKLVPPFRKAGLTEQVATSRRLAELLAERRFDRVINLNYHPGVAAIAEAIPAELHLGARWRDTIKSQPSDAQTEELFAATTGDRSRGRSLCDIWASYTDFRFPFEPIPVSNKALIQNRLGVVIGSGFSGRRISPAEWAVILGELPKDHELVLIGSQSESPFAEELHQLLPEGKVMNLAGRTSLTELIQVIASCQLVVGVDTGPLHLAAALGVPCFGIYFGSAAWWQTGPYGEGHRVVAPADVSFLVHEDSLERSKIDLPLNWIEAALKSHLLDARQPDQDGWVCLTSKLTSGGIVWERDNLEELHRAG